MFLTKSKTLTQPKPYLNLCNRSQNKISIGFINDLTLHKLTISSLLEFLF